MDEEKMMEYLFLNGAITINHIDPNSGEIFYKITPKMFDLFPELYNEYLNSVNQDVMSLWEKGFIDIDLLDDNPLVNLKPKAFVQDEIDLLTDDDRASLEEVKRILSN